MLEYSLYFVVVIASAGYFLCHGGEQFSVSKPFEKCIWNKKPYAGFLVVICFDHSSKNHIKINKGKSGRSGPVLD